MNIKIENKNDTAIVMVNEFIAKVNQTPIITISKDVVINKVVQKGISKSN